MTEPSPQRPRNPLRRESDMFRVLIMFVVAGAVVIAAALLIGTWAGVVIGLVLLAIGLWRTLGLIEDWRRYGSDPGDR